MMSLLLEKPLNLGKSLLPFLSWIALIYRARSLRMYSGFQKSLLEAGLWDN